MIVILYVDDEPSHLDIGKKFLEKNNQFSVDGVTSASEGLRLLKLKEYDAIVADYAMPGMDGIEFLKNVRRSGSTIPFILFTGRSREEVVIRALNEGADYYLQKGGMAGARFTELAHHIRQAVQQRRAETRIRNQERREADIINFLPDATFAIDTKGVVIAWNRAMEQMTGIRASEILGKGDYAYALPFYHERRPILIDLVLAPDERLEHERYLNVLRDDAVIEAQSKIEKPDGTPVYLRGKAARLFDVNGRLTGAIETIRDITESKQIDEILRKNEERLKKAEEIGRSGNWEFRLSENSVACSESARKIYGLEGTAWTIDEVQKIPLPKYRPLLDAAMKNLITGSSPYNLEFKIQRPSDGSILDIHSVAEYDPERNVIFGVIHDITDRKQAEDLTRVTLRRLEALIANLYAGVALISDSGIVEHVNQAVCDLYSIPEPPEDLVGLNSQEMIRKMQNAYDATDDASARIRTLVANGKPVRGYEVSLKNGWIINADFIPISDAEGRGQGRIWYFHDITERKKVEEQLRRFNEELETKVAERTRALNRSVHEKEILLQEIHHRVKNNLQIIISLFRLQKKHIADAATLNQIVDGENRIRSMALVHEKLYRSDDLSSISLDEYFGTLGNQLIHAYAARGKVKVVVDTQGITVHINQAIPLGLIANELISNAIKYAFPAGRTGVITIAGRDTGTSLEFTISDDGTGLPEGFDWRSTKTMGLHIVTMLTDQLGGAISLEKGAGTVFRLAIPKEQDAQ